MTIITYGNPKKTICVDAGLIQGGQSLLKEYQLNNRKLNFKPKDLDYIIITHVHGDHSLALGRLFRDGANCPIIMPKGNKEIYKLLALDSVKIFNRNAMDLTKRAKKIYPPIYSEDEVEKTLLNIKEYPFEEKIELDETLTLEFVPSGHVLNGSQVVLYIKNNNSVKKIVFTGDLGNINVPALYTNQFKPIQNANLLIGECTYANKERSSKAKDRKKDLEKIKASVYDIIENGGQILIPSFAFMRTQVIVTILYDLFYTDENFTIPIYVASPLSCKISSLFETLLEGEDKEKWLKIRNWDKLFFIPEYEKVEELLKSKQPMIFVSSAGMLNAGFAVGIAEKLLPNPKNIIVFVGYSVENSLSWKIKQKKTKTVTINGKSVSSKCKVVNLASFSSHMSYCNLIDYYSGGMGTGIYNKIALQHGNFKDKCDFGKKLQNEIEKRNRTDKVVIVNKSTEILL